MSSNESIFGQMSHLILLLREGNISDTQFEMLENLLRQDEFARRCYVMMINNELYLQDSDVLGSISGRSLFNFNDLYELAEYEKTAPQVKVPQEKPQRELIDHVVHPPREKRRLSKFGVVTIVNAAAMILFFVLLKFAPDKGRIEVATVVDQLDAKWSQRDNAPETSSRLWTNREPLNLQSGIVKIQYDSGVELLVEGPALFEILRSGVYMEYGRLFSRVSDTGLGFIVQTPATQFVDLGTEFGVQADVNGSAELHVIKGKVQLFAGPKEKAKSGFVVDQNKAMRYNANSFEVEEIPIQKQSFARSFDSTQKTVWRGQIKIDLADIVGGGDGYGNGTLGYGIDIATGRFCHVNQLATQHKGREGYVKASSRYIDGVFVFGGKDGRCQVSSEQDFFEGFEPTSMRFGNYPFNGYITSKESGQNKHLSLSGQSCGTKDNPVINMHTNNGITFDLDKFRDIAPINTAWKFTGQCGIADESALSHPDKTAKADFYVLIDGQVSFVRKDMTVGSIADISVDISPSDRFLTLITAEGSDRSIVADWTLFSKPALEITEK